MIVDSSHKPWIYGAIAGTLALAASYAVLQAVWLGRWGGGTSFGLLCGFIGAGAIVFDGLLGIRKKYPTLRVGRTHSWLKAHVWLGLLAFATIVLHSGFSLGGPLTTALMILFAAITASGIAGMALQQFVPRVMMAELPEEAIFEQLNEALENLQNAADLIVKKLGAAVPEDPAAPAADQTDAQRLLGELYVKHVRPYLQEGGRSELLEDARKAQRLFDHLKKLFPATAHGQLEDLENLATRRRALAMQRRLHYILHGWLLVHVPLSAALFVLMFAHAFVAFFFT